MDRNSKKSIEFINRIYCDTTLNININQYDLNDLVYMKYALIT
jgi:hypothetical protein